ncbi:MAG: isochorismatase family protein [Deltaproteobacteria bacterium]|nr:isochorismatase family protein [Deltaproteobacteria bacterium]
MVNYHRKHIAAIEAEPEPISIDVLKTAVIVVDMQNAFVKKGGYFEVTGHDISNTERIIEPCRKITTASRRKGARIIYFQMGCSPDFSDRGPADSPYNLKSKGLSFFHRQPEVKDKFYIYGTWGAEIIEELKPRPEDVIVRKQRYDGFIGTNLEIILDTLGIKYLAFVGTATNLCVESTLRHAFFLDYFPILVSDAVSHAGEALMQEATLLNVKNNFGWVTTSDSFVRGLEQS